MNKYTGDLYEKFIRDYLQNKSSNVWLWYEIPEKILYDAGFANDLNKYRLKRKNKIIPDTGIDILQIKNGKYIMVQCKNYTNTIRVDDLAGFFMMTTAHPNKIAKLYYTSNLTKNIKETIPLNSNIKLIKKSFKKHTDTEFKLYIYQQEALNKLKKYFENNNRGIYQMPCGTGKTIVSAYFAKDYKQVIYLSPLKQFAEQNLTRFKQYVDDYKCLLIDSDGTRDKKEIKKFIKENDKIMLSFTYASTDMFNNIKKYLNNYIIVIDEFHNLSRRNILDEEDEINKILIDKKIKIMFMSATPRIYELENTDEDDDYFDIFGNKAYHMEMKEAIKNKYIADYKIYIPSIHENKKKVIEDIYNEIGILNIDKTYEAKAIFLYKCLTYYGTKKTIVYFKDITDMKNFNIAFKMLNKYYAIDYFIKMITYKITQKEKTEYINKFTNTKNKFCLLFSVHILDECVDIPCCDSIYITYNSNSKIKNVQRMCRANRINDNKNKVAKIFLWCNELDKLPDFLSSVKEFDDEYKDKIVNVQSSYSGYNDEKVEKKDTLGIDKYVVNVMEYKRLSWDKIKNLLLKFCEKEKRCPIQKEQYKNHNIGMWLQTQKKKIKNKDDDIYKKLSINQYVKKNLDEYLINKNKNKDKEKLEWDQLKELLFEFCEKEKRCPIQKEQYKNHNIGMWLQHQKQKIKNKDDDIYKKLSINQYVKKNLDKYLEKII